TSVAGDSSACTRRTPGVCTFCSSSIARSARAAWDSTAPRGLARAIVRWTPGAARGGARSSGRVSGADPQVLPHDRHDLQGQVGAVRGGDDERQVEVVGHEAGDEVLLAALVD